jgi:hypothetical protein
VILKSGEAKVKGAKKAQNKIKFQQRERLSPTLLTGIDRAGVTCPVCKCSIECVNSKKLRQRTV